MQPPSMMPPMGPMPPAGPAYTAPAAVKPKPLKRRKITPTQKKIVKKALKIPSQR